MPLLFAQRARRLQFAEDPLHAGVGRRVGHLQSRDVVRRVDDVPGPRRRSWPPLDLRAEQQSLEARPNVQVEPEVGAVIVEAIPGPLLASDLHLQRQLAVLVVLRDVEPEHPGVEAAAETDLDRHLVRLLESARGRESLLGTLDPVSVVVVVEVETHRCPPASARHRAEGADVEARARGARHYRGNRFRRFALGNGKLGLLVPVQVSRLGEPGPAQR